MDCDRITTQAHLAHHNSEYFEPHILSNQNTGNKNLFLYDYNLYAYYAQG